MLQILAPVDNIRFDIEEALSKQAYAVPLPFGGIDKSASAICEFFMKSECTKGSQCPYRHVRGDKSVLCKHWLRGLCKKGDDCEFLHEYDMSKMPECYFYSKFAQCGNKECEFLHLDPESKIKDCAWYDRGFCRHGPNCKNRHVRKVLCQNYLCGFCLDGSSCKFKHPKFELPVPDSATQQKKQLFLCDYCGEYGHKVTSCFKLNPENRQIYQAKLQQQQQLQQRQQYQQNPEQQENINQPQQQHHHQQQQQQQHHPPMQMQHHPRPSQNYNQRMNMNNQRHQPYHFNDSGNRLHHQNHQQQHSQTNQSEVICYKCGDKGHYANKCNKGVFAFLRAPSNEQK